MRVVYYALPVLLDVALPFIAEMSQLVELHVLLEVHPGSWQNNLLELQPRPLSSGIISAEPVLEGFPESISACWRDVASFNLASFDDSTGMSPANWGVARRAAQFAKCLRPDVMHMEGASGRFVWSLRDLRGIPLALTVHDPVTHPGENPLRKRIVRRITFGSAARFILHNRAQIHAFCNHYGVAADRIEFVPLGPGHIHTYWSDGPVATDPKTILFFGRMSKYKGLEVLYGAAPIVCNQVAGARFVVAGKPVPGYRPPVPPTLPNGGKIEVIDGYISNKQLAELFNRATIVACPYTDATQSGVVLTAYAFGKPVVASTAGGLSEYVRDGETGVLVPPGSVGGLADALVGLLGRLSADPELQRRYAEQISRRTRADFAWKRIAHETVQVYEHACARKDRRR